MSWRTTAAAAACHRRSTDRAPAPLESLFSSVCAVMTPAGRQATIGGGGGESSANPLCCRAGSRAILAAAAAVFSQSPFPFVLEASERTTAAAALRSLPLRVVQSSRGEELFVVPFFPKECCVFAATTVEARVSSGGGGGGWFGWGSCEGKERGSRVDCNCSCPVLVLLCHPRSSLRTTALPEK